jgi:hypothetical protein
MATVSLEHLEQRVAALEISMARLLQVSDREHRFKDWRKAVGTVQGSELMKEIDEAGRAIREADRRDSAL